MYQNITFCDFCDTFTSHDRQDQFTYEGKKALFGYLKEYEESIGEKLELDVIALCCDYTEYDSAWEAMEAYQSEDMPTVDDSEGMDLVEMEEAQQQLALGWLQEHTQVIEVEGGGVIIQNF